MSLKTKVKVGNVTHLGDARYCAGMGVDWLGFPAQAINPTTFKEITSWVTGPQFILELGIEVPPNLHEYEIECVQTDAAVMAHPALKSLQLIISLKISNWPALKDLVLAESNNIIALVVTDLTGDRVKDHSILSEMSDFTVLLDTQNTPYKLSDLLAFPVSGLNLSGEEELKPGLKDYGELADVLEELEVD